MSEELEEKPRFKIKVTSKGEKKKVRACPPGFERKGDQCVRTSAEDKLKRKKSAKKGKIKRARQQKQITRLVKKAKQKRKSLGVDK